MSSPFDLDSDSEIHGYRRKREGEGARKRRLDQSMAFTTLRVFNAPSRLSSVVRRDLVSHSFHKRNRNKVPRYLSQLERDRGRPSNETRPCTLHFLSRSSEMLRDEGNRLNRFRSDVDDEGEVPFEGSYETRRRVSTTRSGAARTEVRVYSPIVKRPTLSLNS